MHIRAFSIAVVSALGLSSGCATVLPTAPASMHASDMNATLQIVFGPPSQAGFGSAVFVEQVASAQDLEAAAVRCYRHFLGRQWAEGGEAVWMAAWRRVYARERGEHRGIVAELRGITDREAGSSIDRLLEGHDNPDAAIDALSAVYDEPAMENLAVYSVGDSAALSGVLIAGRTRSGAATFLVFLMD